jgi:hypothetical protein
MPLLNISTADVVDDYGADVRDVDDVGVDAIGGRVAGLRHAKVAHRLAYFRLTQNWSKSSWLMLVHLSPI